ncbi:hypothetical protein DM01DRAFT_1334893 [Hesseltinella vesiculosa]|uniref:F-box domain-containing protein n=1 Tax=Hesseltinella vesiculosa TaxID=101127 RepID=A0A1X2GL95_9FUNG|nr:hypothetical protein DM01DRAFT_1334893 [Hesseltinella vesiculosa]
MVCLSFLPHEIIQLIATHLSQDDIFTVCCVSRKLSKLFHPTLYGHVTLTSSRIFKQFSAAVTSTEGMTSQPWGHLTRSLVISIPGAIPHQHLDTIAFYCPFITALQFEDVRLQDTMISLAKHKWDNSLFKSTTNSNQPRPYSQAIQDLPIHDEITHHCEFLPLISLAFYEKLFQHHLHLTTLSIDIAFDHCLEADLPSFVRLLPKHLTDLTLDVRTHRLTFDVADLIQVRCPGLTSLSLAATDVVYASLSPEPNLTVNHVVKTFCLKSRDAPASLWFWLWYAGKKYGQQLQTLRIGTSQFHPAYYHHLVDQVIHPCASALAERHASTLQSLEMRNMGFMPEFWAYMHKHSDPTQPRLRHFAFSSSTGLNCNFGREPEASVCEAMLVFVRPCVEKLELGLWQTNDGFDLEGHLGQCRRLKSLKITRKRLHKALQVSYLIQGLPRLRSLTLASCSLVVSHSLLPSVHRLTSLILENVKIAFADLHGLLQHLGHLKIFTMTKSSIFHDDHLSISINKDQVPSVSLVFPSVDMSISVSDLAINFKIEYPEIRGTSYQLVLRDAHQCHGWTIIR